MRRARRRGRCARRGSCGCCCRRASSRPSRQPGKSASGHCRGNVPQPDCALDQREETFAAFVAVSFLSKSAIDIAPGTRSPSSKMIVGVPLIFFSLPKAMFLSSGVEQLLSPEGTLSLVIVSIHDFPGSAEHQMAFDFSIESGERIGYRKT